MPRKPHVTRTYGPIHFEDLEEHRFEALVRNLIYDFRDWQTIEATGKGGSDDGFDVRAWEKVRSYEPTIIEVENSGDDSSQTQENMPLPMDGNLWQIQSKREKEIGPSKVLAIVNNDIDEVNPPYGYILAASADFSKTAHDVFRDTLRKKGVMEFELWGKERIADMLLLPKNDRILFSFFGISLVSRIRSRVTDVRSSVINKNKLLRITGEINNFNQGILVRDINDDNYPFEEEYPDFETHPRWREFVAISHHPLGLVILRRTHRAYVDIDKKAFDFTDAFDFTHRESDIRKSFNQSDEERTKENNIRMRVIHFHEKLPRKNQAILKVYGLIKYNHIALIDDKGDFEYKMPHVYIDYSLNDGPFDRSWANIEINRQIINPDNEDYSLVKIFPKVFLEKKLGIWYKSKPITIDSNTYQNYKKNGVPDTLLDVDGRYKYLRKGDLVAVVSESGDKESGEDIYLEVTHKYKTTVGEYTRSSLDYGKRTYVQRQIGSDVPEDMPLEVIEVERRYMWSDDLEKYKKVR